MAASQTEQIAASQQRQAIPRDWQLEFALEPNDVLKSISEDSEAPKDARAYARWEWEYRKAFDILLARNPESGEVVRIETEADLEELEAAEKRIAKAAAEGLARLKVRFAALNSQTPEEVK